MTRSAGVLIVGLTAFVSFARAADYPLQFTPNAGYRGLVVAGYQFVGDEVVGNCSYYTVSGKSGRGSSGGSVTHQYQQTCRWDLYGNLISITPGEPFIPQPLYRTPTQTVYAVSAKGNATGTDVLFPERGFVNSPGPHFSWLNPESVAVINQALYTFQVTLKSDGDVPLTINSVTASAVQGRASVKSTTCNGELPAGSKCSITVNYDPTALTSPTGLAFDTVTVAVTTNSEETNNFVQSYVVIVTSSYTY